MSARIPAGDSAVSPPAKVTPNSPASFKKPSRKRSIQFCDVRAGVARDKKAATGAPPIAATSLRPRARQRCPIDSGECHSRRKCTPSKLKSVVTRISWPAWIRRMPQSSPIPVTKLGLPTFGNFGPLAVRECRTAAAMRAISNLSGRGNARIIISAKPAIQETRVRVPQARTTLFVAGTSTSTAKAGAYRHNRRFVEIGSLSTLVTDGAEP